MLHQHWPFHSTPATSVIYRNTLGSRKLFILAAHSSSVYSVSESIQFYAITNTYICTWEIKPPLRFWCQFWHWMRSAVESVNLLHQSRWHPIQLSAKGISCTWFAVISFIRGVLLNIHLRLRLFMTFLWERIVSISYRESTNQFTMGKVKPSVLLKRNFNQTNNIVLKFIYTNRKNGSEYL